VCLSGPPSYVRSPVGGAGGCFQTWGGGNGFRPGTTSVVRNTQTTCPVAGRAADGLTSAGQPSECSSSPTNWYGGQVELPGGGIDKLIRARRLLVDRSTTTGKEIFHLHRSRGMYFSGRPPNSARSRYHSAHAVSGESAKYIASTTEPRCQRPSAESAGRCHTFPRWGMCLHQTPEITFAWTLSATSYAAGGDSRAATILDTSR